METILSTKLQTSSLIDKNDTRFVRDVPKIAKYSLADSAERMDSGMDYHIQIIQPDEKQNVLKFLRRFFFRDEPLNHSIGLIPEGEDSTCLELEEYCSTSIVGNNLSLMAVSSSGDIIGVLLNGKMEPHAENEPEYITECKNSKFKKILKLLYHVDEHVNVDDIFKGSNVLEFRIVSVDSNWRGKGIGKALIKNAEELAKERCFNFLRMDCTSMFSSKLAQRCGFDSIYELKFSDYVDENGKPIFSPAEPHTSVVSYIKKL